MQAEQQLISDEKPSAFDNQLVYEAKSAMLLSNNQCGACERIGFPIFLVRKSVVPKYFKKDIDWSKGMLSLGQHREPSPEPAQNAVETASCHELKHHHYAYRTLREGYLYILLQKREVDFWHGSDLNLLQVMVYEITRSGAYRLREFRDSKGTRPKELPQACLKVGHQFRSKFITIDNKIYQKGWIAYSQSRWDLNTINHYRDNETERNLRFTVVDLNQTQPQELTKAYQQRSFGLSEFTTHQRYLVELACSNQEVLDYEDMEQQTAYRQAIIDRQAQVAKTQGREVTPTTITQIDKELAKGIFYAKNIDLDALTEFNSEQIFSLFENLFCTASHFNSLQAGMNNISEFTQAIQAYQSNQSNQNNRNKFYQVDDISVVVVEDSLGLAEELSVQRRQLLAPVTRGLMGTSQEQAQAIQNKLNANAGKTVNELIRHEKSNLTHINPDIADAFYQENILDLRHNHHYKMINDMPPGLRFTFLPNDWLQKKLLQSYVSLFGKRAKAIDNYFKQQLTDTVNKPLACFKAETRFAHSQYGNIQNYQAILKQNQEESINSECILFAFYNPTPRTDIFFQQNKLAALEKAKQVLKYPPQLEQDINNGNKEKLSLDDIVFYDLVGEREFAIENKCGLVNSYPNLIERFFHFRYIKEKGIGTDCPPLGDYVEIALTAEQKKKILAIYEQKQGWPLRTPIDVVAVKFPSAKSKLAEWNSAKAWKNKENKRLYNDSLASYEKLAKQGHQNITHYAEQMSKDYFTYLLWLFGSDNPLPFWLNEQQADNSDVHLMNLQSLLAILDNQCLGNLHLKQQTALWIQLLYNQNSIYYQLLTSDKYSLFNVGSGNLQPDEQHLSAEVKAILASQRKNAPKKATTEVDNPLADYKEKLDYVDAVYNLTLRDNVTVGAYLIEELVKLSLANVANALSHHGTYNLDQTVVSRHLVQAMNMFSVATHKSYRFSVNAQQLPALLNNLGEHASLVNPTGSLVSQDGTTVTPRHSSRRGGYYFTQQELAALKGKQVELNMLMTFEDDAARQRFEQGLTSQRGNVKPDKFIGSTPIKYEELHAAKYQIKKEVLKQGIDISVSGVQHLFTLAYQYIQMSLLDKGLKGLNDSALIDKMSLMLAKSYLQLAVAAGDMLITSAKFYGLFFAKNKTLLDTLSKIGNKFGYIGKTITIIDSLGDMLNASKALTRGDTGSASFMINSTIGLIAACALGLSMPWTIVLLIAPHLLNYLFGTYEDGSNWDEMEKWINRSIFGRFDHNDLFPPYPISDTGHYLSEQDYYLASRKGFCRTAHYQLTEQECYKERLANRDFKAPPMPASKVWGDDSIAYMNKLLESQADPYQNKPRYNLNLVMQLPDFVKNKAKFEGTVTIRHKDESQDTILAISRGEEALTITPIQCNAQCFFAMNDKMVRKNKDDEHYEYFTDKKRADEKNKNKENNPNRYWLAMQQVISESLTKDNLAANSDNKLSETTNTTTKEPNIGLFQINQMLGRVIGEFEVICVVKYWPEGKTDGDNHPLFPYLLSYQHNVLTMINSVKKSAVELFS